jgi:imidazolonepropionase-like amidohydrolase
VLVVGNTIRTISSAPITPPPGEALIRIAGAGRVLMPGLIDNHVHVLMSASSRADLIDPKVEPKLLQERATAEAGRMLLRGFTSVRDLGGPMLVDRPAIDRGSLPGPRIYPSGALISQTSVHGDSQLPHERSRRFFGEVSRGEELGANFIADGRDEVLTATREDLRAGAGQIKVMAGGGAASDYDPLDVTQYTLDDMKAAV